MSGAHTPGPWKLHYDGQIDGNDGKAVCFFTWDSFKEFNEGANAATARLISAAPDMLMALQHVEAVYRLNVVKDGEPSSTLANLQAVIAKATGANHE